MCVTESAAGVVPAMGMPSDRWSRARAWREGGSGLVRQPPPRHPVAGSPRPLGGRSVGALGAIWRS